MKCPICHKSVEWENNPYRPFCSERCKLLDFGAWANGEYAVPAEEVAPSLEEEDRNAAHGDEDARHHTSRR
jgi:endogenous inhibitor of DNA gyrase (YacG/DUF329 family)